MCGNGLNAQIGVSKDSLLLNTCNIATGARNLINIHQVTSSGTKNFNGRHFFSEIITENTKNKI